MRRLAILALTVLAAASCAGGDPEEAMPPEAVVRVLAASSLAPAFDELAARFVELHPTWRIDFTYANSSTLVGEIDRGRAAAVLATASPEMMRDAEAAGHVRGARTFARNHLSLVAAADNPLGIDGFAALARADVRVGLCEPTIACGDLGLRALEQAGVGRGPSETFESSRSVVLGIVDGEVDAGLVFTTAVPTDGSVTEVLSLAETAPSLIAVYEITVLAGAVAREEAELWVTFVLGPEGQRILAEHGFSPA